jgi:DNA-binding MarR family transcriptional regulator
LAIRNLKSDRRRDVATAPADPDTPHMDRLVTVRIVQLAEILSRGATEVFEKRFGVKNTELRILVQLEGREGLTVNELSRRTRVDKAWISRSLKGLERRGLVGRTAHPSDTRASLVSLTPAGEQLVEKLAPVATARSERLVEGLDKRQVDALLDALAERAEALLQSPDES